MSNNNKVNIKVLGVGGGGCNAVDHMSEETIQGVRFYGLNTDLQALERTEIENKIQIGEELTKGLGAGADPEKGRQSAEESEQTIKDILEETDMVFVTAGMGGGTGTGAAPVVARIAKEMGILTIGIVTKPFGFENRMKVAEDGIKELEKNVDCLLVIPNSNLKNLFKEDTVLNAFNFADDILLKSVKGIAEIITRPSIVNVDFADIKKVMSYKGAAMLGMGESSGENKTMEATKNAINTPLLETNTISGAKGVLINIVGDVNFSINELDEIGDYVRQFVDDDAKIITGFTIDQDYDDTVLVTVVATDIEKEDIDPINEFQQSFKEDKTKKDIYQQKPSKEKEEDFDKENNSDKEYQDNKKIKEEKEDIFDNNDNEFLDIPNFLKRNSG
tara:strand:- start:45 stop:1211 length:1167 start_codon:yes stop_codon:yes gene_type:complete